MNVPNRQSGIASWIDWLLNLHAQEIDLGLERVRQVAEYLDITRPAPFVISVAGTNGKGSSVAMLVAILKAAGYRVGAYTSPHIQHFNERIQINGIAVDNQLIVDAFAEIEHKRNAIKLTYFEFATLAALKVFKEADLDVVVLEVGLGGRLDAVNIVDADAALITAIDVDHVEWLGNDRSVIATEKAGITRQGKPAVCSDPCPPSSLRAYLTEKGVPLSQLNRDFVFAVNDQAWSIVFLNDDSIGYEQLPFPALKGAFQIQNAAGVVALLTQIAIPLPVTESAIRQGLLSVNHPGRLQKLRVEQQNWLIDVAHNPQSAQALAAFLAAEAPKNPSNFKRAAVFSVLSDKDALPMVEMMAPWIDYWFVADLGIARAKSADKLMVLLQDAGVAKEQIFLGESICRSVENVLQHTQDEVLVWGSFFTVAQVYDALHTLAKIQQAGNQI